MQKITLSIVCVVVATLLITVLPATAQDEHWVILRVKQLRTEKDVVVLTLRSGQQVSVPEQDVAALAQPIRTAPQQPVTTTPTPSPSVAPSPVATAPPTSTAPSANVVIPTPDGARPQITALCARAFPNPKDRQQRTRCEESHKAAIYRMWQRPIDTSAHAAARNRCATEGAGDFLQQDKCEAQYMPAALERAPNPYAGPSSDDSRIRAKCADDWPNDYVMQKYCIETQTKARDSIR